MKFKTLRFTLVSLLMMLCGTAWADNVTDELTYSVIGVTGTSYTAKTGITATSDAVYAAQSAGGNQSIQLRSNNNNSGIVSTTSGGKIKSVTITFNGNTAEARVANIYGSNSAYESPSDLYNTSKQGTLLGTISAGNPQTVTVEGDYEYIGIRSASGAMYIDKIEIVWETGETPVSNVATPTFTPNGGKFVGTTSVEIACETEGATIYYSMNGEDPVVGSSPQYGRALPIAETTTVKAIAVKGNDKSAIASATFTQIPSYSSFTAMSELANNAIFGYTGKAFIVAKPTDKYVYLYNPDEQDFALIYDNSGAKTTAAEVGKYITPGWTGKVNIYRNLFELVPDNDIVVNDDPAQPVSYPAIALGNAVMNQVFTLKDVTNFAVDSKNITIKANGDDKDISEAQGVYGYNQFNIEIPTFEEGKTYQMVGAIGQYNDKVQFWPIEITEQVEETPDAFAEAKTALQTAIAIASNINPEGLADAITAAQAALTAEGATAESLAQATLTLEAAIKAYFNQVLPNLGAIVTALNDSTLNAAYADAQAALAKENVTPQELTAAMQQIIVAAQAVAPAHLQNLKGYAVKYGATEATSLIDAALAAIEAGNVAQIITTMTAVKEAATPLAQQVLSGITAYVQAFGLTEQAAQAQAAMASGNYITMITTAKTLFTHLIAAAQEYLPKLGDIAEGLNDETLNTAYAAAEELLAKESITPEELGAAMQNIIVAAKAVAPEHLQNLKGYAVKYGAEEAAALVDSALVAIEAGNVSQIIATMTAVKTAATPLAQQVLSGITAYVQAFGLTEQAAQAQAAMESGNYITMITTAKALFTHLIAAAQTYLPALGSIAEGLNDETLNTAYAAAEELLAKESITPEELGAAMQNIIVAAKAVAPEHLQNLKGYAVKYGAEEAAALVDSALVAIEAGNVSQIITTMTAVKEAATPLATSILTQMIENAMNYNELADDVTAAQAALQGGNYIAMIITAKDLYAKLIAAGAPAEVTLTDGNDLTALLSYVGQTVNLTYTRSFTEGKTSTVCLPFAYEKKEGDGSFYAFTNIEKEGSEYVATMTEPSSTTLEANTPYLYLPNATGDVDFGGAYTIPGELTAGETTSNGWTFKGTFETIEWEDAPTGTYGFAAQDQDGIYQGQFVKVGDYVRIKPMRCYLVNESFAGVRGVNRAAEQLPDTIKVRLVDADGNETGIGTISTKTGEVTIDNDAWYTLDGRRVVNPTKGVYVKNGKKVSIK